MMVDGLEIVLYSTDEAAITSLNTHLREGEAIWTAVGNGPDISRRFELDALWLTPMMATYFGVVEVVPLLEAGVFDMPEDRRLRGLPSKIVSGVRLDHRDYSALQEISLVGHAIRKAVMTYNEHSPSKIRRIGAIPETLGITEDIASAGLQVLLDTIACTQDHLTSTYVLAQQQIVAWG